MAEKNYSGFCVTPTDAIAKPPSGPRYSTSKGTFDGEDGYPKRTPGSGVAEKTFDDSFKGTPQDETRGTKG